MRTLDKEAVPQEVRSSSGPGPRRDIFMATEKSSAPHAHPSTDDHDDTVEAHYACLERPCACLDGWVFLGRVVESEHDLDGEVVEYERVPCRRCADSR
jgi:hypothetical protein